MSGTKIRQVSLKRDAVGNIREYRDVEFAGVVFDRTVNASTATGSAAAIYCTLPATSGKRWVLDSARLCIASIAANTAVLATLVDGTTALAAYTFSANGSYELSPGGNSLDDKLKYIAADNSALALQVSSAGTGSTTTANVIAHKATTADV